MFQNILHISNYSFCRAIGSLNLSRVDLKGVDEALLKYEGQNVESKGIKAHFAMDDSGILSLLNVDYVAEKTVTDDDEEQSTLQKIGSSFTKLFGGKNFLFDYLFMYRYNFFCCKFLNKVKAPVINHTSAVGF